MDEEAVLDRRAGDVVRRIREGWAEVDAAGQRVRAAKEAYDAARAEEEAARERVDAVYGELNEVLGKPPGRSRPVPG